MLPSGARCRILGAGFFFFFFFSSSSSFAPPLRTDDLPAESEGRAASAAAPLLLPPPRAVGRLSSLRFPSLRGVGAAALAGLQKRTVIHDNRRPARRFDPGITIREGGGDAMRRGLPAKRERCARAPASQPSNRLALSAGRKVYTLTEPNAPPF
jgi:hypothetical protein